MKKLLFLSLVAGLGLVGCNRLDHHKVDRQEEQDTGPRNINRDIRDSEIETYQQRQMRGQQGQQGQQGSGAAESN